MSALLHLKKNLTQVNMPAVLREEAVSVAHWVTASPHEHVWPRQDQELMAGYCLWAAQRLSCIEDLASGKTLCHAQEEP